MEKMHISFIKDLKNIQFFGLFIFLEELLDKNKSENTILMQATERIKSHHEKLVLLRDTKLRHYLTQEINKKVSNRTEYLTCLRLKIEACLHSPKSEERIAADRLKLWMRAYKKDIHKPSIAVQGQLVKFLLFDREENEDIQKAATLLYLDELLEVIENITIEVEHLYIERIRDRNRKTVNAKEVRKSAYRDLQLLIYAMELVYSLSTNEEEKAQIVQLSKEINEFLKSFYTALKSRKTKSKNKKELDEAVKNLVSIQDNKEKTLPIVVDDEIKRNNINEKFDSQLSQKASNITPPQRISFEDEKKDEKLNKKDGNGKSPPI